MKKLTLIFMFLMTLASCSTLVNDEIVSADTAPKGTHKGKVNKVAFNSSGLKDIVQFRRKDAFEKIVSYCGSNEYELISEKVNESDDMQKEERIATFSAGKVTVITFKCL